MADERDPRIELLEAAWKHPEARKYMEEGFAKAFPNADIPGRAVRVAAAELTQTIEKGKQEIAEQQARWKAEQDHNAAVADLRRQGYDDEAIKAIEKIMTDEGVGLHANAAVIYETRTKVAPPRTVTRPGSMSPQRAYTSGQYAPYFRGIMDGPFQNPGEDWARSKVDMILNDFATDRVAAEKKWTDDSHWPADPNFPAKA